MAYVASAVWSTLTLSAAGLPLTESELTESEYTAKMSVGAGRTDPIDSVSFSKVNKEVCGREVNNQVNRLKVEVSTLRKIIQEKKENIENLEKEFLSLKNQRKPLTSE